MKRCLLVLAACASAAKAPAPPAPDLEYTFRYVAGPAIEVAVECASPASEFTTFEVDKFADVDDPEASIRDVHAEVAGGGELAVDERPPRSWRVRAPKGMRIVLHYTIFSRHAPTPNDRFRTIVTDRFVHFVGMLALAAPEHLGGDSKKTIRFRWQGLGALHPATTFGAAATVTVHEELDHFLAGAFLAAPDLRLTRRHVGDGVVEVATVGTWKFSDRDFADRVAEVIAMERTFFHDPGAPYYFVSAWPLGKGPDYGGTGYTHSFDLAMSPDVALDASIVGMLAHEHFHNWNGEKITPEAFEQLTYWVTEGFTDFYSARLRYRSKMITLADYAREVNDQVRSYLTSPVKELSNARAVAGFWTDEMVTGKLPYYRGNAIALVADREIRRESDGHTSLDDVVRMLAGAKNPSITSERVIALIEGLTSTGFAAKIRATAIDGAPLAIPADLFAPCMTGKVTTTWTYDLGFDWTATDKARAITGLRAGSAAAKAGIHDGDKLRGTSIYFNDVDKPVELDVGDPVRHISYLPRGRELSVPVFAPGDEKACPAILGEPLGSAGE